MKFSNRKEGKMSLNIIDFEIFIHISMNITLKNIYVLIGEHVFIIFFSLFVIKDFRGICSSFKKLNGYMAREIFMKPWSNNLLVNH